MDRLNTIVILIVLVGLIGAGGGALVWVGNVPASELTPAHFTLIDLADTVVKGALGAFLGFVAGARLPQRNGGRLDSGLRRNDG